MGLPKCDNVDTDSSVMREFHEAPVLALLRAREVVNLLLGFWEKAGHILAQCPPVGA